jgi:lipid II:glycine glycyltransferase (peptidoglycan interpeptide bridge formation enzyme)
MIITNSLDEQIWREYVKQHPQGNIFQTPEMYKIFAKTKGYRPTLWAAVKDTHRPLALFVPVQIILKGGGFYRWTTRAVAYGSILCDPGLEGIEALKLLLLTYKKKMQGKILFTELRNLSDLSSFQPAMNDCNFFFEDHMNFLIDLDQSEEALWHNLKRTCRQNIRAAAEHGIIVEEVSDRSQLPIAYHLLENVYTRIRVPLTDISLFESAYDVLAHDERLKIFLARLEDHFVGVFFILIHNQSLYAWYAGSDRAYTSCRSQDMLIWHILKWGKEHGFHEFDFGGGGKPSEEYGPRKFKEKFGGKTVYYGRNICIHSPLRLRISKQLYLLMQKVSAISSQPSNEHGHTDNP